MLPSGSSSMRGSPAGFQPCSVFPPSRTTFWPFAGAALLRAAPCAVAICATHAASSSAPFMGASFDVGVMARYAGRCETSIRFSSDSLLNLHVGRGIVEHHRHRAGERALVIALGGDQ